MAIVTGPIKLEGRVGDLIFYRRGNKTCCRSRPVYKPESMTAASKQSSREFGKASNAAKILREALNELWPAPPDGSLVNRANKAIYSALRKDTAHSRGKRVLTAPAVCEALKGLHLNSKAPLRFQVKASRQANGSIITSLPQDWPRMLQASSLTTHIQVQLAAVSIDFATGKHQHISADIGDIPFDTEHNGQLPALEPGPAAKNTTLLVLQMRFIHKDSNGKVYEVGGGKAVISCIIDAFPPLKQPKATPLLKKPAHIKPPKHPFTGLRRKKPRPAPGSQRRSLPESPS
jgi:hypothetical protein